MTSEQFEALAKLISLRGGQSEEAAAAYLLAARLPAQLLLI